MQSNNQIDVNRFFRTYDIFDFTVSKDEEHLFFCSNFGGEMNIWGMDLPNNFPFQVSYTGQDANFIIVSPDNKFILAGLDEGGNEQFSIYKISLIDGEVTPVLIRENHETFYVAHLSQDGESFYYTTNKDNQHVNICRYNLKTMESELKLVGTEGSNFLATVSPAEEYLVYMKAFSNTYILAYLEFNGKEYCLTPDENVEHKVFYAVFKDENTIYLATNYKEDFSYLAQFNIDTMEFTPLLKLENEEINTLAYHSESDQLYFTTEKGVIDKLYQYNPKNEEYKEVKCPVTVIDKFTVTERGTLYVLGRSSVMPHNLYKKSVNGLKWIPITNNRISNVKDNKFIEPDIIRYKSYDGLVIEGLFYRSRTERSNGFTVFWAHGGPQGAERIQFRPLFQILLQCGYNIFAPNFRGSTGYGAGFTKLVEGDWGNGPRIDCLYGIKYIISEGMADANRILAIGGSYGGYMTLLLSGRHPELFCGAVDLFGPSNLFTFIDSVPDYWKPMVKRWVGDPEKDYENLFKASPINYVEYMDKPLLIIQGENDSRVKKVESDQIVEKLRERDVLVDYIILPDEGHGFSKKENELYSYNQMINFIEKIRKNIVKN